MPDQEDNKPLHRLAAAYGVLPSYRDSRGRPVRSPASSVVAALRSLGAELPDGEDVPSHEAILRALEHKANYEQARVLEPVMVAWEGRLKSFPLGFPGRANRHSRALGRRAQATILLEDGSTEAWDVDLSLGNLVVPQALPPGYHSLQVEFGDLAAVSHVISAPRRCWEPEGESKQGEWGIFAPTYALRSGRNWGAGDLADLAALADWTYRQGGAYLATLPLLASFTEIPGEISPYRPVSRLFWNEFYLAVDRLPEWKTCGAARDLWEQMGGEDRISQLRESHLVDHQAVIALKRAVLEKLTAHFFDEDLEERRGSFLLFLAEHPEVETYARFRAAAEEVGPKRASRVSETVTEPTDSGAFRYHLYVQWQMEEQMAGLFGRPGHVPLFLDLPVGVHPDGFDAWRWPELFVREASCGAPPDDFFAGGQNWNSPPLNPTASRETGHRYVAGVIRRQMQHVSCLRIDHVMWLHRLFWVPSGVEPADGVYVTYPAEELYAVLALESCRSRAVVVGEDLGTVPSGVRPAMRRHNVRRTWVFELATKSGREAPFSTVPSDSVAMIDTHDTFPLAGFAAGDDIRARVETRQLDERKASRALDARSRYVGGLSVWLRDRYSTASMPAQSEAAALLAGLLSVLVHSDAWLTIINLEDLSLETRPQNMPGTDSDRPNWQRKTEAFLEHLASEEAVLARLDPSDPGHPSA